MSDIAKIDNHPAVRLGTWLKDQRKAMNCNARVFAGMILLSPAEYAEVEAGVVKWIGVRQQLLIATVLNLPENIKNQFDQLILDAQHAKSLKFSDIFTKEQLAPIRLCQPDGKQLTKEDREAILRAVFTELEPIS